MVVVALKKVPSQLRIINKTEMKNARNEKESQQKRVCDSIPSKSFDFDCPINELRVKLC